MAHPDDETLAIGARISRFTDARFVHVTDGAPQDGADATAFGFVSLDEYRDARASELHQALAVAGLSPQQLCSFAIPDQQAALHLVEIARRLAELIADFAPEVILTHAYEGGHPDHDSCAFAVHHAALRTGTNSPPLVIESPLYHAGPHGMETEAFLPNPGDAMPELSVPLTPDQVRRKRERLACFVSQRTTLELFPIQRELFRVAPAYDFTRPPHPPPVFYDQHPWGITSTRFCELAAQAARELATRGPAASAQGSVPCH